MKYSIVYVATVASLSNAFPLAQFDDFSLPSFPMPTGGFSFGGFSIPSFPGLPAATKTVDVGGSLSTSVKATTTSVSQPSQTGSTGGGTVGENCTPQGNGGGSTENGVKDKNCCTDVTVIFARGTGETGNVGTVSGPPMFKSLRSKLGAGRVTVQGVDYPASAAVSQSILYSER